MNDSLTLDEVARLLAKFPIDGQRSKDLFSKEPALEEAFKTFSERYVEEFDKIMSVEIKESTKKKLLELFVWSMVVGYLTKDNLIKESIERALRR